MIHGVRTALAFAIVVCACACGAAPPEVVTPPPLHVTAAPPKPAPQRARWVFSHPETGLHAKLDLGDGRTLYAGNNGRREIAKGSEPLVDAPTLAIGDLIAIRKAPSGELVFIAADGTMYLSKDPMGPLDTVRPGPVADGRFLDQDAGKTAMLGIHPDGRVLRSTDFGQTWSTVDYAGPNKPYGKPANLAMDSKGNGIILHMPQRLYVTHDDGATWAPLAAVHGIGARQAFHDGSDRLFVRGFNGALAVLDGNALVATSDKVAPIYAAPPRDQDETRDDERGETRSVLVGDHVVELVEINRHGRVREIKIGSAPLGEKIAKSSPNTELVGESGLSKHIASYGRDLVYLRDDDDADEDAPTTTVYRSKDFGATWVKESQLQGVEATEGDGVDLAIGPKGWAYVTSLCAKDERSGPSCARRQIRPAGGQFEDMSFTEEFEPKQFAFDEARDKVYAIGVHEGRQHVYESPLSQNKFSRTKLLDVYAYTKTTLTVDSKGSPRAFEYDYSKGWILHKRDDAGKEAPPMYLAIDRGNIAFIGDRGLIFASRDKGWETNDGGDTWMRVATNGYARSLACSEAGCVSGDAARVGWDLPAVQTGDKITVQAEPTKPPQTASPPRPPAPPTQEITCKVSGAGATISQTPGNDMVDGVAADRWASVKHDSDGKMSIVVGTKSAVRELPLLAALPKPPAKAPTKPEELRSGETVLTDGVVAARYRFTPRTPGAPYNPVDVELAWWSAVTGRTQHHTLSKVGPFRVSRYGFSGTPQIVDGGILFQGALTDPAYFVHDDGKVEQLKLPPNASVREAERLPKRWILADSQSGVVQISASDDNAKTWKQTVWGLSAGWGSLGLTSIGDKATITYGNTLLFPIDATLSDDPPAPVIIDDSTVTTPCDAHAGRHRFTSYIQSDQRPLRVRFENAKGNDKWTSTMSPSSRVMHDTANGRLCTSAYYGTGYDRDGYETTFVYPEANGAWSGWRFHRAENNKSGVVAEPLTCK